MATTIEQLEVEISSNSSSAVSGIDALSASLTRLKSALQGGIGLSAVSNQLKNINNTLKEMDGSGFEKISKLAESLEKLKNVGNFRISPTIGRQLANIGTAIATLSGVDFAGIERFSSALEPLKHMGRITGLSSVINALSKLPAVAQSLNTMDMESFTRRIRELTNALSPLAIRLNIISNAFNRLPNNIRRLIDNTDRLTQVNNRTHRSYIDLWAGINLAKDVFIKIGRTIAEFINKSNQYIEDLNLFHASMGEYASEAKKYAEQVGEILGIDPGQFMRNQGTFQTIITGFGVVSDKAYLMSKNLTQLGYDISSYYNIAFENAMQKLQSGISGELEPLRRLGYDLSVARLQEEALALGIKKKVSEMTQAEKSQLRYYAIMTQVTTAQGDMARTMNAPANQIRIFSAQIAQCARAIGNIFIPALNAILPYAIAIVKVIRLIADSLASVMGFKLPEVDYSDVTKGIKDTTNGVDKYKDSTDKATKATKKLKNAMLGIDELNILSKDDDALKDLEDNENKSNDLGIKLPEYDFLKNAVNSKVDAIVDILKGALAEIEAAISAFALVFGTILVVSGVDIPLGIALIAVGAVGLVDSVVSNWNAMSEPLARTLTFILGLLGGFFFVLGVILVVTGNVPLGIALMVIGAAMIVTALAINWTKLKGDIENVLVILAAVVGGALLILGVVLVCSGFIPLGIAAIVAGITMLVAAAAINWGGAISQPIKSVLAALVMIVAGAFLALGVIMLLAGHIPLGIGLLVVGAVALATAVALNWSALTGSIGSLLRTIIMMVSGALLGIGVILLLTGVSTPLGIGLIVAGAVGLAAAIAMNFSTSKNMVTRFLKDLGAAIGISTLAIGVLLCMAGVLPLGIGLIVVGASMLGASIALNWGAVKSAITQFFQDLGAVIGIALLQLGVILCMAGNLPLGIGLIVAGAAAIAYSVSLNWGAAKSAITKFLKDLGTIVGVSMVAIGVLLCCVGLIPIGVSLIVTGLGVAATGIALNWGEANKQVGRSLGKINKQFNTFRQSTNADLSNVESRIQSWSTNTNKHLNTVKDKKLNLDVKMKDNVPEQWGKTRSWWDRETKDGLHIDGNIKLIKEGWTTVKNWVGEIPTLDQHVELRKQGWQTLKGWIGPTPSINQNIELRKQGWHNVKDWMGNIPTLSQDLSLRKNGWTTVRNWVGDIPNINQDISLRKQGWHSVRNWVGDIPTVNQDISLRKRGWDTVKNWVGDVSTINQNVELKKHGWQSIKSWIGDIPNVDQNVELKKHNWNTVKNWIGEIPYISQNVELRKHSWSTIKDWIGNIPDVIQDIKLRKQGWDNLHNFVKGNTPDTVDVRINLISQWKGKIKEFFGLASGGIVTAGGGIQMLASGGTITHNMWQSIPKYANGMNNIHGSMFIAGEAGAELVGHVNGTTEVLNRFQLAQVMRHSIVSGMAQFAGFWQDMSRDIITCTNGIINAITVCTGDISENMLLATNTGYITHDALSRDVYDDSKQAYSNSNSDDTWSKNMREFYHEYVEPTLREIAADTKRQADKNEKTVVQVGNRVIDDAVTTQRRANGFSFIN
jgi:hypothetical protein|nr:MAG TPA: minor tail protein [Caudoviricetes sp.]